MWDEHDHLKYQVAQPRKLSSWTAIAKWEITKWYLLNGYKEKITRDVLSKDENPPGPFTKFLYHFAFVCRAGWGVFIDFSDRHQRIYLCDDYYKWMHKLRDEVLECIDNSIEPN